jgi:hypothetical protein
LKAALADFQPWIEHGRKTEMETMLLSDSVAIKIKGARFTVSPVPAHGIPESVHQTAVRVDLLQSVAKCLFKWAIQAEYENTIVVDFGADLYVSDVVIVEEKWQKLGPGTKKADVE